MKKYNLLYVDDEESNLRIFKDAFRRKYNVFTASSTKEGIEILEKYDIDLVLSDQRMPEMSGVDFLRYSLKKFPAMNRILITAYSDFEAIEEAINRAHIFQYIKKPWDQRHLEKIIQNALRLYMLQKENKEKTEALKKTKEKLEKSEAKYKLLSDVSFEGIFIHDKGIIIEVNAALLKMFGYKRIDLIGKNVIDLLLLENYNPFVTEKKESNVPIEVIAIRKDGSKFPAEIQSRFIKDKGNKILKAEAIRDISERKNMEQQYFQMQKMEAIGKLAGGIAHDFNNLLTVINGFSEILLNRLHQEDPIRKEIGEIRKAGERANSLTSQLLAFSRRQLIKPKRININTCVQDIEKMLRRIIGEDIELETILDPDLANIKADKSQIDQVIMNLAINARDAINDVGKLTIETNNVVIDEEYVKNHISMKPGRYVMLAISDNGCGMDRETLSKIFEPFFTTKEAGKGTGLGLSTVYGIIKQNNGYIWVYSEPGQGTTFKIYFPRVDEPVEKDNEIKVPTGSLKGDEVILVVEDDYSVRKLTVEFLSKFGYSLLEAENGKEALTLLQKKSIYVDLIITDVIMPKMSGRELEKRIAKSHPKTKILFVSGYTDNAIAHHGVLEEGVNFLSKPFRPLELAQKVRMILDEK